MTITFFLLLICFVSASILDDVIVHPTYTLIRTKNLNVEIHENAIYLDGKKLSQYPDFLPTPGYVQLNSTEGQKMFSSFLQTNDAKNILSILMQFETQKTQTWCSLASFSNIYHGLSNVEVPIDKTYNPFPWTTQEGIYENLNMQNASSCVSSIVPLETITSQGATLEQLAKIIECYISRKYTVEAHHASEVTLQEWISTLKQMKNTFIIVNFSRIHLSQMGGGHFSVIGFHDEASNSALLLDTARYKYPHIFVAVEDLFRAMNTTDTVSKASRGWISIRSIE